ncbi:MAG: DNA cytosine methyltransferase [Planctomycetia bacterium]|nr:DNA cytosine methyltransferase [Planctomycetia bacterium]
MQQQSLFDIMEASANAMSPVSTHDGSDTFNLYSCVPEVTERRTILDPPELKERKVVSFFSGAMGLDIGLMRAGLNVVIGQDFDASCVSTMRANGHEVLSGDVRALEPSTVLERCALRVGEPFLVCGGPPCQPFSTAGKRLGMNDPRGSLFMDFIRMIDHIRPRFFIMENVKGLVSSPLKHVSPEQRDENDHEQRLGTTLDVILSEFDKLRYKTVYGILDAVNYGTPQFRERFVMIGSRDGEDVFLPFPTHFQRHQAPSSRWRTLYDAISDLDPLQQEFSELSPDRKRYLHLVPEGGNWRDLPKELIPQAMGGAYESGGGKVGFYRRLSWRQPSPTLTTSPGQKATLLGHPTFDRPLSVQEYARIQQFPDDWIFAGNTASKYKQIGNAVPVGLGFALGQAVIATANNSSTVETKRYRGTRRFDGFYAFNKGESKNGD